MAWGILLYKKKEKIIRESELLDFEKYIRYWLGPRNHSYLTLNILLHISVEDFWFQLAFYSLLLDAGCQTSNLLMCTIPWVFYYFFNSCNKKSRSTYSNMWWLRAIRLDCDFNLV